MVGAYLRMTPSDLLKRTGIKFEVSQDDLVLIWRQRSSKIPATSNLGIKKPPLPGSDPLPVPFKAPESKYVSGFEENR